MNSVFQDNKSQSKDMQSTYGVIYPQIKKSQVSVYKPLDYASLFERAPVLIPSVVATPVTTPTKKRKSVSTQTEFNIPMDASDNDILEYFRTSKNIVGRELRVQEMPRSDPVLGLCDEDVGLYCCENSEEIFDDIDMNKQLREMTALHVQKPVWVNGSEFRHIQGSYKFDPISVEMYSSFQDWGTDKSPFVHSIFQLY